MSGRHWRRFPAQLIGCGRGGGVSEVGGEGRGGGMERLEGLVSDRGLDAIEPTVGSTRKRRIMNSC